MAYLSDIFSILTNLNLLLQGQNIKTFSVEDKILGFLQKVKLCWNGSIAEMLTISQHLMILFTCWRKKPMTDYSAYLRKSASKRCNRTRRNTYQSRMQPKESIRLYAYLPRWNIQTPSLWVWFARRLSTGYGSVYAASIYARFTFSPLIDHDWRGWWVMTPPDFLDTDRPDIAMKL
jgi:hypothetical protein